MTAVSRKQSPENLTDPVQVNVKPLPHVSAANYIQLLASRVIGIGNLRLEQQGGYSGWEVVLPNQSGYVTETDIADLMFGSLLAIGFENHIAARFEFTRSAVIVSLIRLKCHALRRNLNVSG